MHEEQISTYSCPPLSTSTLHSPLPTPPHNPPTPTSIAPFLGSAHSVRYFSMTSATNFHILSNFVEIAVWIFPYQAGIWARRKRAVFSHPTLSRLFLFPPTPTPPSTASHNVPMGLCLSTDLPGDAKQTMCCACGTSVCCVWLRKKDNCCHGSCLCCWKTYDSGRMEGAARKLYKD